jgi:hypothetical protein
MMNENKPWVADGGGCGPEYEDILIGNREGLTKLKEALEKAITEGETTLEDTGIEYNGIKVVDADPRKPSTRLSKIVSISIFLFVIALLLLGLITLIEIIK